MAETCGIISGIAVLFLSFKFFFRTMNDFKECLRFWFTPDIISLFRGEWEEDHWAELKLFLWLVSAALPGFAVYWGVEKLLA